MYNAAPYFYTPSTIFPEVHWRWPHPPQELPFKYSAFEPCANTLGYCKTHLNYMMGKKVENIPLWVRVENGFWKCSGTTDIWVNMIHYLVPYMYLVF